jgi:hypothetical protein
MGSTPHKRFDVPGLIANVANAAEASGVTTYNYLSFGNEGYSNLVLIANLENTTLTLEGAADADSVALASMEWRDVTQTIWGISNLVVSGELVIDTDIPFSRLRVKSVTTNATNSRQIRVSKKG